MPRGLLLVTRLLLAAYLAVVLVLTLTPTSQGPLAPNLVPLAGIRYTFRYAGTAFGIGQLVGNLLLLMPFGALARVALPRLGPWTTIAAGLSLSVLIELVQWRFIAGRMADIDDVWVNTLGCAIGVGLVWLIGRAGARLATR
jgi:glycopeptide antibiotics resistance protein